MAVEFDQPRGSFGDGALSLSYVHASRHWFWLGTYEDLGRGFRADTGFIPRVDTLRAEWITEHRTWASDERTTEDFIDLTEKDRTLFVKFGHAWVMQPLLRANPSS